MKRSTVVILVCALAKIGIQLSVLAQPAYELFRDEFYYLACAKHLAWGFVDQPPFSIALLWTWISILGDSLVSLRLLAALIGVIPVVLTGVITQQLGGQWKAQALACIAVVFAPIQIGIASFYSMNVLEYALIPLLAFLLLRIIQEHQSKLWLLVGVILGLGIMNKHTFAVLAACTLIGFVVTPMRVEFARKFFWMGIALAVLMVLPNVLWQISNNFISLEFYRNATAKNVSTSPLKIIVDQIINSNPVAVLLWIPGLIWFLRDKNRHGYRILGIAFLLMLSMMMVAQSSRPDRIASFVPVLVAGGAVVWEQWNTKRFLGWLIPVTVLFILSIGLVTFPVALPVLSPQQTADYVQSIGMNKNFEQGVSAQLPQNLADRFGWKALTDTVHSILLRLPPEERNSIVLAGQNYGEAGALEYYGRAYGLPLVICGHNSYWLWGPGEPAQTYIIVGNSRSRLEQIFGSVQEGGRTSTGWQMNYECNRAIWICREPKKSLQEIWPAVKYFI